MRNISEESIQKRVRELQKNTDFVATLFDGLIGYAIIAADFDGNIIAYNEGARLIYGYAPEEVIGKQNIEIFFPKDFIEAGKLERSYKDLLSNGHFSYEGEKVRKNGESFIAKILFILAKDKACQISGFVEMVEDLTERKKAEEALADARANEERVKQMETELRSLVELSHASQPAVTARMYGVVTLLEGFPNTFRNLVDSYGELMDLALEQQAYKVKHDISGHLGAMAETLGFYKAGPRDVVDIHTTALKEKTRKVATVEKKKAYTGEGWIMILELMGYMVSFYRNRAQSSTGVLPNQQMGNSDESANTREAENE